MHYKKKSCSIKSKKALSPLIATAILISAAIAGGLLLYQYFNNTMTKYIAGEDVVATIAAHDTGTGQTMYFYTIRNTGSRTVTLIDIKVFAGANVTATINLNKIKLGPGDSYSNNTLVSGSPSSNMYAVVEYSVGGKLFTTKPVAVSIS